MVDVDKEKVSVPIKTKKESLERLKKNITNSNKN